MNEIYSLNATYFSHEVVRAVVVAAMEAVVAGKVVVEVVGVEAGVVTEGVGVAE